MRMDKLGNCLPRTQHQLETIGARTDHRVLGETHFLRSENWPTHAGGS
jgi:hypothetical protein